MLKVQKAKTDNDILQMTEDAMKAGAKGVTYGRNIFAHKNPTKDGQALAELFTEKRLLSEAKNLSKTKELIISPKCQKHNWESSFLS